MQMFAMLLLLLGVALQPSACGATSMRGKFSSPFAIDHDNDGLLDIGFSAWDSQGSSLLALFRQVEGGNSTFADSAFYEGPVSQYAIGLVYPNPCIGATSSPRKTKVVVSNNQNEIVMSEPFAVPNPRSVTLDVGVDAPNAAIANLEGPSSTRATDENDLVWGGHNGKISVVASTYLRWNKPEDAVSNQRVLINTGRLFAAPTMCDLNQDGLLDLIVGGSTGGLSAYLNVGTQDRAEFSSPPEAGLLASVNSALEANGALSRLNPVAADFSGSGDGCDLVVGSEEGVLLYFERVANFWRDDAEDAQILDTLEYRVEVLISESDLDEDITTSSPTAAPTQCECSPGLTVAPSASQCQCTPCKVGTYRPQSVASNAGCLPCGITLTNDAEQFHVGYVQSAALNLCPHEGMATTSSRGDAMCTISSLTSTPDRTHAIGDGLSMAWFRDREVECGTVEASTTELSLNASKPSSAQATIELRNTASGMPLSFSFDRGNFQWVSLIEVRELGSLQPISPVKVAQTYWYSIPENGVVEVTLMLQTGTLAEGNVQAQVSFEFKDVLWGNGARAKGSVPLQMNLNVRTGSLITVTSNQIKGSLAIDANARGGEFALISRSPYLTDWSISISPPAARQWLAVSPSSGTLVPSYTCLAEAMACNAVAQEDNDLVMLFLDYNTTGISSSAYYTAMVQIEAQTAGGLTQTEVIHVDLQIMAGPVSFSQSSFVVIPADSSPGPTCDIPPTTGIPVGPKPPSICIVPRDRFGTPVAAQRAADSSLTTGDANWMDWSDNITVTISSMSSNYTYAWNLYNALSVQLSPPFVVSLPASAALVNESYLVRVQSETGQVMAESASTVSLQPATCKDNELAVPSSGFSRCSCIPGYGISGEGQSCSPCAPGFFADSISSGDAGLNKCTSCPVGKSQPNAGASDCLGCDFNQIALTAGSKSCESCDVAGKYAFASDQECRTCPPGRYLLGNFTSQDVVEGSVCAFCPGGRAAEIAGNGINSCLECPPGKKSSAYGTTWQEASHEACSDFCNAYTFSPVNYVAPCPSHRSLTCPLGKVSTKSGADACEYCNSLLMEPDEINERTQCVPCAQDWIVDPTQPSRRCLPCPQASKMIVRGTGEGESTPRCYCDFMHYRDSDGSCVECPDGALCAFASSAADLLPMQGYWRSDWSMTFFAKCRDETGKNDACPGVKDWQKANITARAQTRAEVYQYLDVKPGHALNVSTSNMSFSECGNGHTGTLCHSCIEGWTRSGDADCVECLDFRLQAMLFVLGALLGIAVIIYLIRRTIHSRGSSSGVPQIMMLKILVTHCQIVAMAQSFPLEWPPAVRSMFDFVDYTSSAGTDALDLSCLVLGATRDRVNALFPSQFFLFGLCILLTPVVFALFAATFWMVVKWRHEKRKRDKKKTETESRVGRATERSEISTTGDSDKQDDFQKTPSKFKHLNYWLVSLVVFFFVVHPSITRIGLKFFACSQAEEMQGKQYLEEDFSVECHTTSHYAWSVCIGLPILILYGVGVPFLALWILHRIVHDPTINSTKVSAEVGASRARMSYQPALRKWRPVFGFLYNGYKTKYFYWEVVTMGRKVCFAFISILLQPQGPAVQAYTGLLILLLFLMLHVKASPHEDAETDNVEFWALSCEIFTMILGLYLFDMPVKADEGLSVLCTLFIIATNSAFLLLVLFRLGKYAQEEIGAGLKRKMMRRASSIRGSFALRLGRMSSAGEPSHDAEAIEMQTSPIYSHPVPTSPPASDRGGA